MKIGKCNIRAFFIYQWQKTERSWTQRYVLEQKRLGIWLRIDKAVSSKGFSDPSAWSKNLVNSYKFGIDLIVAKFWVTVDFGVKYLSV